MYIHQPQLIVQRLDKSHGSSLRKNSPRKNYSKKTKPIIRTRVVLQQLTTGQCVMTCMKEHSFSFIANFFFAEVIYIDVISLVLEKVHSTENATLRI